ncbi:MULTISPECIES: hypothetical protein [Aerosakkonema]|uniref:hypothetical protein n=1 Tax=Aerosakkonema TaxID=1246629 RepID=UPI0035B8A49B
MFNKEVFLRAEIDRLEAEVLWLKLQLADLKDEVAQLKANQEDRRLEDLKPSKAIANQIRKSEKISG